MQSGGVVDNASLIEKTVLVALPLDRRPTEQELLTLASAQRVVYPVDDEQFAALIRRLHANLDITMDRGTALVAPEYGPWLSNRKSGIDPFYWDRFRVWLDRLEWPVFVINTLDGVADEILDLAGDPKRTGIWARRGLVVGDVQSGKTATYTALACKAADAGYKLIILLTGMVESLRRQTQERLDEGFVGLDSSDYLQQPQVRTNRLVGVGLVKANRMAGVFTSRSNDFNRQLMNQLGFTLDSFQEPVLVVIKKNKSILANLESWLRGYNADGSGKINAPLLMIDDEADWASINTKPEDADPTAINAGIRSLLSLFNRSCYVGVTATPFANVFIDPESDDDMLGDDLFPRDFIYSLEAPTNYIGPQAVFANKTILEAAPLMQWNWDADVHFPVDHRSTYQVQALPETLYEAVRQFLIASTLRDLHGEKLLHRSMLVNVSRFTAVQDQVANLLDAFVRDVQRDIRNYGKLDPSEALQVPSIAALQRTWGSLRGSDGPHWRVVQEALNAGVQPVQVRAVNQRTGAASLDYKSYKEQGLRVIAVGGDILSRGLTLEGLSTSYFHRNSQMYDTLLQMGRWFGYRDGYADLCRIWLGEEAFGWYGHIATASDELRQEFKRMKRLGLTPREFGLKVRAHPDSLIVTARNKMRTANTIIRRVSLSAQGIETARLRTGRRAIEANAQATEQFIRGLGAPMGTQPVLWSQVPSRLVADYLEGFDTHPLNYDFQADRLAGYLRRTGQACLRTWDVALPFGRMPDEPFAGLRVRPLYRYLVVNKSNGSLLVSGSSARVGSRGDERAGLTDQQIAAAEATNEGRNTGDRAYREVRSRPLLLIHVLRGFTRPPNDNTKARTPFEPGGPPLVAIGLSFPRFDDSDVKEMVEYKVNLIEWRSLFEQEIDDDTYINDDAD
jgi:hypothetical protein